MPGRGNISGVKGSHVSSPALELPLTRRSDAVFSGALRHGHGQRCRPLRPHDSAELAHHLDPLAWVRRFPQFPRGHSDRPAERSSVRSVRTPSATGSDDATESSRTSPSSASASPSRPAVPTSAPLSLAVSSPVSASEGPRASSPCESESARLVEYSLLHSSLVARARARRNRDWD